MTSKDQAKFKATIEKLEAQISEQTEKITELDKSNERLSKNVQMEQDTSNNLMLSLQDAQTKNEQLS